MKVDVLRLLGGAALVLIASPLVGAQVGATATAAPSSAAASLETPDASSASGAAETSNAAASGAAAVLARHAGALVRVEAVLETRVNYGGQGEAEESRLDLLGAVVDPSGLIMIWNSHVSSARMAELMRGYGQGGEMDIQVVPRSFQVELPGGDAPAFLAATDSALDLAFLQLERPPAAPLPWIDYGAAARPEVGDTLVALSRLGRAFDHAPFVQTARMGGVLRKPREAWILDGTLTAFGLPVFDLGGAPVGALTTVATRAMPGDGFAGSPTVGQVLGGAFGGAGEGPLGVFVLPGERVASLVRLAGERARELLAERTANERSANERSTDGRTSNR